MSEVLEVALIDSDEDFCDRFTEYFSSCQNFSIIDIARDGEEGLELIKKSQPDVLVLDLILPNIDGMAIIEELEGMEKKSEMTVIVLTAFMKEKVAARLRDTAVDYYLLKPVEMETVKKRIEQLTSNDYSTGEIQEEILLERDGVEPEKNDPAGEQFDLEAEVSRTLHKLGVPAHIRGYLYLREAIMLVIDDIEMLGAVTKELYPRVAEKYDATSSRVERAIRHAVKVVWENDNREELEKYFASTMAEGDGRPTNSQFIAEIAERIRIKKMP